MVSIGDILKLLDQIPIWKTLKALPARVETLEKQVAALEQRLSEKPAAAPCPKCRAGMEVTDVVPDPTFGDLGGQQHTLKCPSCGHTEKRLVTPNL